jgi:hypothetical protein
LIDGTFSLTLEGVADAVHAYRRQGTLPQSRFVYGTETPVDPITGQYIERLLSPGKLTVELQQAGFDSRVYAYLGGAGGNPFIKAANTIVEYLSPLTWPVGRAIKVVAKKRRSSHS